MIKTIIAFASIIISIITLIVLYYLIELIKEKHTEARLLIRDLQLQLAESKPNQKLSVKRRMFFKKLEGNINKAHKALIGQEEVNKIVVLITITALFISIISMLIYHFYLS